MRPKQEWSIAEVEEHLKQMQRDIAAAESVLVIGGGPTGIEMAGVSLLRPRDRTATEAMSVTLSGNL